MHIVQTSPIRLTENTLWNLQVIQGEVPPEKLQKGGLITAVATHKEMLLGQKLRLEGHWTKHKKYGNQLEVRKLCLAKLTDS